MKLFILAALCLTQSALASRTPEAYCVSKDGAVEVRIFNDSNRERESEVNVFDGEGFEKVSGTTVARKDVNGTVYYLGENFGLNIETTKTVTGGVRGNLYFSATAYAEPVSMICRLSK